MTNFEETDFIMKKNGLTLSMVFEASSTNYGEGFGNISVLKKLTRSGGKTYTFLSRQAVRYNIINQLVWDTTPVVDAGVSQFAPEATIENYPEIDLFGYMKTESKGKGATTRSAVARLSNAVSLEEYNSDIDFLTNMSMAKRANMNNAIAQAEIHKSLYAYTITVDLDRVGIDGEIEIENSQKVERVIKLLEAVQFLYRDIKGRRENLNPVFAIGGLYERKNPYFEDRIKTDKGSIDMGILMDVIDSCEDTKNNTRIGCIKGMFKNAEEIEKVGAKSISDVFNGIKKEVEAYYA